MQNRRHTQEQVVRKLREAWKLLGGREALAANPRAAPSHSHPSSQPSNDKLLLMRSHMKAAAPATAAPITPRSPRGT